MLLERAVLTQPNSRYELAAEYVLPPGVARPRSIAEAQAAADRAQQDAARAQQHVSYLVAKLRGAEDRLLALEKQLKQTAGHTQQLRSREQQLIEGACYVSVYCSPVHSVIYV